MQENMFQSTESAASVYNHLAFNLTQVEKGSFVRRQVCILVQINFSFGYIRLCSWCHVVVYVLWFCLALPLVGLWLVVVRFLVTFLVFVCTSGRRQKRTITLPENVFKSVLLIRVHSFYMLAIFS